VSVAPVWASRAHVPRGDATWEAFPKRIPAGQLVRLLPELPGADVAHIVWQERRYACSRDAFLRSASSRGPAPE
jgi:hypothetical protein